MKRSLITINCINCNKNFQVKNYRKDTAKYCSKSCNALHSRIRGIRECEICKKSFEFISSRCKIAKYCSRKCYHKSQIGRGEIENTCIHCGKIFRDSPCKKRKYCSKQCVNKSEKSTWKATYNTIRKNMFRRGMIEKCQICGFNSCKEILGIHHIDKNNKNNNPDNLMVLCPNCHSMQHKEHIVH